MGSIKEYLENNIAELQFNVDELAEHFKSLVANSYDLSEAEQDSLLQVISYLEAARDELGGNI